MRQFLTLNRRKKSVKKPESYRIDWNGESLSKFQRSVKQFLRPYWSHKDIYEEFPVVGTRMTLDFLNLTNKIAIEVQGAQHGKYNKFMHAGNVFNFVGQVKRDIKKEEWCEINEIFLVEIFPNDVLSEEYFANKGVNLI